MDLSELNRLGVMRDYEISDSNFKNLIDHVLSRIPDEYLEDFPSFSIYQGPAKEGAYVTDDFIMFDVDKLDKESDRNDKAKIGLIAHELAHVYLGHYNKVNRNGVTNAETLRYELKAEPTLLR